MGMRMRCLAVRDLEEVGGRAQSARAVEGFGEVSGDGAAEVLSDEAGMAEVCGASSASTQNDADAPARNSTSRRISARLLEVYVLGSS